MWCLLPGGVRVGVVSVRVVDSVWDYCSELYIRVLGDSLGGSRFVLEGVGGSRTSWVVVGASVGGAGGVEYRCYPAGFVGLCSVLSVPVCGEYRLDELCGVLGLPFVSVHGVDCLVRHWWVLGRHRGVSLFDRVRDGSGCIGGGCGTFHYGVGGYFQYSDLRCLQGGVGGVGSSFSFTGRLLGDLHADRSFGFGVSGVLDMCFDGEGGVGSYRRVVFGSDGFLGGYKSYLSNDCLESYREWSFRNRYWRSVYRSMVEVYEDVEVTGGVIGVGVCCHMDGLGVDGVTHVCVGVSGSPVGGGVGGVVSYRIEVVRIC